MGRNLSKGIRHVPFFSPSMSINISNDHFRGFKACRLVSTLLLVRESSVGRDRAVGAISFPPGGERRPRPAKAKVNVRTFSSAPRRRGYYRQCGIERSQFPRSLRYVGHARCCLSTCPLRVSLPYAWGRKRIQRDVYTNNKRPTRTYIQEKIVKKMRPSHRDAPAHRVRIALLSLGE